MSSTITTNTTIVPSSTITTLINEAWLVASVDTPMESGDIATVTVVPMLLVGVDLSVLVQFVSERE